MRKYLPQYHKGFMVPTADFDLSSPPIPILLCDKQSLTIFGSTHVHSDILVPLFPLGNRYLHLPCGRCIGSPRCRSKERFRFSIPYIESIRREKGCPANVAAGSCGFVRSHHASIGGNSVVADALASVVYVSVSPGRKRGRRGDGR